MSFAAGDAHAIIFDGELLYSQEWANWTAFLVLNL